MKICIILLSIIKWLAGWLACWLAGLLAGWLSDLWDDFLGCWVLACWFAGLLACWLAGLLACWLADLWAGLLACWLVGLLACWLAGLLADRRTEIEFFKEFIWRGCWASRLYKLMYNNVHSEWLDTYSFWLDLLSSLKKGNLVYKFINNNRRSSQK